MNISNNGRVVLVGRVAPVNILEPRLSLEVAGPARQVITLEATIDTGFSGWLTLPETLIEELNLTSYGPRPNRLANDSVVLIQTYSALVQWCGQLRPVIVSNASNVRPLIGTALLENFRLTIDMWEDGAVTVTPRS